MPQKKSAQAKPSVKTRRATSLATFNDDLNNLYVSIDLPILFLGRDLRIRRFTPQAEKVLSLISTDVGRPVGDIKLKLNVPDLEELIVEVIDTASAKEREVQDTAGHWYSMCVRPYLTLDKKIDGAVIVLVDIDELKRSAAEISAARDYAEAIIETVREPLIVLDERLRVRTANRSFYEDFQVTPEETENRLLYELGNHQWDIPALRTLLEEILPRDNQFQDFAVEHEFESIGLRTMLLNARRLEQKDSGAQLILLAIEDITERKRGGETLRASEERFRTLVEQVKDYAIFSTDTAGRATSWNEGVKQVLGFDEAEFIGLDIAPAIFTPEDVRSGVPERELHTAATEGSADNDRWMRRKDGTRFYASGITTALKDELGAVVGFSKVLRDNTEHRRAEEALRESEARFRGVFTGNMTPMGLWTKEGRIPDANGALLRLLGYEREELVAGRLRWTELTPAEYAPLDVHAVAEVDREGFCAPYEKEFIGKDGRRIPILIGGGRFSENTEIGIFFVVDLTERKRAEEERERLLARERQARAAADDANRLKDEFLATVSHELRTPLTAIMGWADMLKGGRLDDETAARAVETIARNAHAQNQLIADLLDVSRIISGKLRFEVGAVDLIAVIKAALETVRPAAEAKGIELRVELDETAGLVPGDADRLQQVVWNLLANAVKYTHRGGLVEARLEREGTHVAVIVRDTGEGIGAETLPYIFDRFRQADGTTTRKHGGLGLGLAIVRHLTEAHGGTVRAASRGADQGTTFTVTLPLIAVRRDESNAERADAGEAPSGHAQTPQSLNGLRVLVVDDDPDARELLTLALAQAGAEVRADASARAALDTLDQWIPDVLVSDIGMPGEDGYALIREVRARAPERGGLIPALALTGYASADDERRAVEAGFRMHVPKPVKLSELIEAVASIARRAGKV